jgi:hypothetical protein|tara:strand:- start:215 stop:373 length:159 start_codon:yes stop_codon:yes gene_type:complete
MAFDLRDIVNAILRLNPNAKVTARGTIDDYELEWLDGTTPISKEDIETELNS